MTRVLSSGMRAPGGLFIYRHLYHHLYTSPQWALNVATGSRDKAHDLRGRHRRQSAAVATSTITRQSIMLQYMEELPLIPHAVLQIRYSSRTGQSELLLLYNTIRKHIWYLVRSNIRSSAIPVALTSEFTAIINWGCAGMCEENSTAPYIVGPRTKPVRSHFSAVLRYSGTNANESVVVYS